MQVVVYNLQVVMLEKYVVVGKWQVVVYSLQVVLKF